MRDLKVISPPPEKTQKSFIVTFQEFSLDIFLNIFYASDLFPYSEIVPRTLIPGNHVNLLQDELNLSLHYMVLPTFTLTHHVEPFIPGRIVPKHLST